MWGLHCPVLRKLQDGWILVSWLFGAVVSHMHMHTHQGKAKLYHGTLDLCTRELMCRTDAWTWEHKWKNEIMRKKKNKKCIKQYTLTSDRVLIFDEVAAYYKGLGDKTMIISVSRKNSSNHRIIVWLSVLALSWYKLPSLSAGQNWF